MPMGSHFELRQGVAVLGEMEPASQSDMDAAAECLGRTLDLRLASSLARGIRVESRTSLEGKEGPSFQGRFFGWGRIVTPEGEVLRWRHGI